MWEKVLVLMAMVILVSGCVGEQKKEIVTSPAPEINSISDLSMFMPSCENATRLEKLSKQSCDFAPCYVGTCFHLRKPLQEEYEITVLSGRLPEDMTVLDGKIISPNMAEFAGIYEVDRIVDLDAFIDKSRNRIFFCGNCKKDDYIFMMQLRESAKIRGAFFVPKRRKDYSAFEQVCNLVEDCILTLSKSPFYDFSEGWVFQNFEKTSGLKTYLVGFGLETSHSFY